VPEDQSFTHTLIEMFMVEANEAVARLLDSQGLPFLRRVHPEPEIDSAERLRQFIHVAGFKLPRNLDRKALQALLAQVKGRPESFAINLAVLKSLTRAEYSPERVGHYALASENYCHFTSPIRRYADLLVHRALIRGLRLGAGTLEETEAARFPDTAEHISQTERRAAAAERDAVDRYLAAFMADRVGATFAARISGVTRFGLFVTVEENGASGIVPLGALPDDRWFHDEAQHALTGRRTGLTFTLAQPVEVMLAEATPRTGGMVFHLLQGVPERGRKPPAQGRAPARSQRGSKRREGGRRSRQG